MFQDLIGWESSSAHLKHTSFPEQERMGLIAQVPKSLAQAIERKDDFDQNGDYYGDEKNAANGFHSILPPQQV
jgi:hypothetical protein